MTRINRRRALSLALSSVALAAAGCAAIPTRGEVNHYADPRSGSALPVGESEPEGPQPGASPREIIEGFIHAGSGVTGDYSVARQFLTGELAQSWAPDAQTLVYNTVVTVEESGAQDFKVLVPAITRIDSRGLATSYPEAQQLELDFSLQEVEGEWRISRAPNGTVLTREEFSGVFNPFTLYYYDPTFSYAVPDIRWFAERATVATSMVRVLVEGPAPYLSGAVVSAVPRGAGLAQNSVPVENEVARVQLDGSALGAATALELERLRTQLTQTLSTLATVKTVELTVNGQVLAPQGLANYREPVVRAEVSEHVVGLDGNRLVVRPALAEESGQVEIYTAGSASGLRSPAMNYTRSFAALVDDAGVSLVSAAGRQILVEGAEMLAPSFDAQNWLWVADASGRVRVVLAGQADAEAQEVDAGWLEGSQMASLTVARDGCRVLVVTGSGTGSSVWVSAVRRAEDGTPLELMEPVQLGAGLSPSGAEWISDTELIVWDREDGSVELLALSGENSSYRPLPGVLKVVAGSSLEQALAVTQDGGIFRALGGGWSRVETSLTDVNYSG